MFQVGVANGDQGLVRAASASHSPDIASTSLALAMLSIRRLITSPALFTAVNYAGLLRATHSDAQHTASALGMAAGNQPLRLARSPGRIKHQATYEHFASQTADLSIQNRP